MAEITRLGPLEGVLDPRKSALLFLAVIRNCFWLRLPRNLPHVKISVMTEDDYNAYCASLPATTYVVQWGGAHVWKVGGKVFGVGWWNTGKYAGITFKVSEIAYEILKNQDGLRPAPYFASRGMKWIQNYAEPGLSDEELREYLATSHHLVSQNLTRKLRRELGLM
jgi:predicted DNA-binding protein (MmcQ/YjbR family)